MAQRFSWLSVVAKPPSTVLAELDWIDTGEPATPRATAAAVATASDGACLIVFDEFWHPAIRPEAVAALSKGCWVVGCSEDERVNTSLAFLYRDGQRVWQVSHVLDEGALNLDIVGKPPRLLVDLARAAKARHEAEGHDAMFSVPGALAEQVCGVSIGRCRELGFTRLESAQARRAAEAARRGQAWADEISGCFAAIAEAQGFARDETDHGLRKSTPADQATIYRYLASPSGEGAYFSPRIDVRNHHVQSLMALAPGISSTETAVLDLSEKLGWPTFIMTNEDRERVLSGMRERLPGVLRAIHDLKTLECLVNDGSPRHGFNGEPTLSHWDYNTGFSRLILAWLAGNPAFNRMIRETDESERDGPKPDSLVQQFAARLRAEVPPLA